MTFFWKHLIRVGVTGVLTAGCLAVQAGTLSGKVIRVIDGDTIVLVDKDREQHKVRLAGVDAPEKRQPFGQRSKQQLAASIAGKFVDVRWSKRDRYQRIVGVVLYAPCQIDSAAKP